jgi:archaeal type IV pilus assembly protein PilA
LVFGGVLQVKITKNSEAVSPVIGTILMVAVTVILAAIIAMYVFGVPSNVTKTKVVAVSAQMDTNKDVIITYQGGQDDASLSSLKITGPDGNMWYTSSEDGALTISTTPGTPVKPRIGAPMIPPTPPGGWPPGQMHVMVVGVFSDGVDQVILDTYL